MSIAAGFVAVQQHPPLKQPVTPHSPGVLQQQHHAHAKLAMIMPMTMIATSPACSLQQSSDVPAQQMSPKTVSLSQQSVFLFNPPHDPA